MLLNLTLQRLDDQRVWDYTNPGNYYFKVYKGCKYEIELWGGNGGTGCLSEVGCFSKGGTGSYIKGTYTPAQEYQMFVIVGGMGGDGNVGTWGLGGTPGFNGGGKGGNDKYNYDGPGGGGGASEIRQTQGINTRLMVAGGGSGGVCGVNGAPGGRIGFHGVRGANGITYERSESYGSGSNVGGNGNDGYWCPGSGSGAGWVGGKTADSTSMNQAYYMAIGYGGTSGYDEKYVNLGIDLDGERAPEKISGGNGMVRIKMLNFDEASCLRPRPSPSRSVSPSPSKSVSPTSTPSQSPSIPVTNVGVAKKSKRGKIYIATVILSKGASK